MRPSTMEHEATRGRENVREIFIAELPGNAIPQKSIGSGLNVLSRSCQAVRLDALQAGMLGVAAPIGRAKRDLRN
jgi:hypothetical protein